MEKEMQFIPVVDGDLRKHMIRLPACIRKCSGIQIFGRTIKSIVFTTDVAILRNCNADAAIAVYPFTPQPAISHAIINAADIPVFCGVGGGTTRGKRVINLAMDAEFQGAMGVVLNAPTEDEIVAEVAKRLDIPVVITIASERTDIAARIATGAEIFNVSAAARTPQLVRKIRSEYPEFPIMATGGPSDDTIMETIEAGANAITYTPSTNGEIFSELMKKYRDSDTAF